MTTTTAALSRQSQRVVTSARGGDETPVGFRLEAPAGSPLRLTRRGRLLFRGLPVILSVAALTATAAFLLGVLLSPAAVSAEVAAEDLQTVTVMPGDSLWSIAEQVAQGGQDPRDVVRRIDELNALHGAAPELGQELYLPPLP